MNSFNLLTTLASGVLASFALFFLFYKVLKWNNKLSALLTILIVQLIYIPLAILDWAGLDVFAIHFAFFVMSAYGLGIITSKPTRRALSLQGPEFALEAEKTNTGWFHWIPAIIVGFFLTLAVVDATIITLASKGASAEFMARFLPEPRSGETVTSKFTGPVAHDFRQKYEQFNTYVEQVQVQRERGWVVTQGWEGEPSLGQPFTFRIDVQDKNKQPIQGAMVEARFLRPADQKLDRSYVLPEANAGVYGNVVDLPAQGSWLVVLTITRGAEKHEVKGELWVKDNSEHDE